MPMWLSVVLGTMVTTAPQFISFLPAEVQGAMTAVLAMATSIYHLYLPSPASIPAK